MNRIADFLDLLTGWLTPPWMIDHGYPALFGVGLLAMLLYVLLGGGR
jgi:hypothetical protein